MSAFLSWFYPGDTAAIAAAAAFVQITVVIVAAAAAARLLKRRAALRHAVWLSALGCVLVSPLLAVLAGRLGVGVLRIESPHSPAIVEAEPNGSYVEPLTAPPTAAAVSSSASSQNRESAKPLLPPDAAPASASTVSIRVPDISNVPDPPVQANPWRSVGGALFLAWILGAAFLLLRLLHGIYGLTRLRRGAAPLNSPRIAAMLDAVRHALGFEKLPPILTSPLAPGPAATGVIIPCVLLPEGLINALDDGQLGDVLIHECAHLLRRDPLVGLLQRLAGAFFWPHPLLPYLNRRLARAREEVCDDYVLQAGDARTYARTLLTLAEGGACRPVTTAGLFDTNWKLEDRVAGLLDPRRTPMTRVSRLRFAGLAAGLLAISAAGAVVCAGGEPAKPAAKEAKTDAPAKEAKDAAADPSQVVVEGVVVDEQGKPVSDALVRLVHNMPPVERVPVQTGADGSYRFVVPEGLAHDPFCVASVEDGARQGIPRGGSNPNSISPIVHQRIVVKASRTMTVRVTDAAKKPVEGATVGFVHNTVLLAHAETGARGEVSLRVPSEANVFQVVALKPGVGFDYFESYPSSSAVLFHGDPPAEAALTLDGARTLSVRAVDSANKPLPGVELYPDSIMKKGKLRPVYFDHLRALKSVLTRTGPDGVAAFDWLPTVMQGRVRILCAAEYSLAEPPSQAPAPPYETLTAKLLRNTRISGTVTLPDGKPAAGVRIQSEGYGAARFFFREVVRTNADGRYTLHLGPGLSYIIAVTDDQWAAPSKTGVVVKEDEPRDGLDFRLGKGTLIRGKVTFDEKNMMMGGQPIELTQEGNAIAAPPGQTAAEQLSRLVLTDREGGFAARVGPGRYWIGALGEKPAEITVKDEERIDKDLRLRAGPVTIALKGVVLANSTDGKPVAGAILHGKVVDESWPFDAVADAKGRFVIDCAAAKRFLYARDPEGTQAAILSVGADESEVKVALNPAGKLLGRVLDKSGKPWAGIAVYYNLRVDPQTEKLPQAERLYAQTDAAGRFTLPGVVPGAECRISAFSGKAGSTKEVKVVPATKAETVDLGDLVYDP